MAARPSVGWAEGEHTEALLGTTDLLDAGSQHAALPEPHCGGGPRVWQWIPVIPAGPVKVHVLTISH